MVGGRENSPGGEKGSIGGAIIGKGRPDDVRESKMGSEVAGR